MTRPIRAWCVLVVLAACQDASSGAAPATSSTASAVGVARAKELLPSGPPLTVAAIDRGDLEIVELRSDGARGARLAFDFEGLSYSVRPADFPPGSAIAIGGVATPAESRAVDASDVIAALPPRDALLWDTWVDPKLEIELRVPGFAPTRVSAPPRKPGWNLRGALAGAIDHPVLFKGETAQDPPAARHTLVHTGGVVEVFGPATALRDVDWVAVEIALPAREGRACPAVEGGTVALVLDGHTVKVVERKTSRVVVERAFVAADKCRPGLKRSDARQRPGFDEQRAWLRDVMAGTAARDQ